MKKKLLKTVLFSHIILALMFFSTNSFAKEYYFINSDRYGAIIADKLLGGITNIGTSFLEVPKNMINTSNEGNLAFGLTGGLLKGVINAGGRIFTGLLEVATFPVPTKAIPQPTVVWEDFDANTNYDDAFRLRK